MTTFQKRSIYLSIFITILFFFFKLPLTFGILNHDFYTDILEISYHGINIFIIIYLLKDLIKKQKEDSLQKLTSNKLNEVLISQSYNDNYFSGNINQAAQSMTQEAVNTLNVERSSVWLFNKSKTSITCLELFDISNNTWSQGTKLLKKDYKPYFDYIESENILVAEDAESHIATKCFNETYLKPLGIKSMLDVPIIYLGEKIGVICIESSDFKKWSNIEINFTQMLSTYFSFSYSIREKLKISNKLYEFDNFIDNSVLLSRTDSKGKITYVNKKFEEISGYSYDELIGEDHSIVNSSYHNRNFWTDMYKTTIKHKTIWNNIVVNKTKNGDLYWVDSYIKAEFDDKGKITGFVSIRYDVTDLIKKTSEIEKKNTYLEHSSKIIRHDMHSGINTYIPRGISSLERRLNSEIITKLKLTTPLKMIKEGLAHTQKVYKGVYEFTNLVKKDAIFNTLPCDLRKILYNFLNSTSYKDQVLISNLPTINVNESLFCTAIDNLIRNGLRYNDSDTKIINIYMETDEILVVQDNGRGMSEQDFEYLSKPYTRKLNQTESGSGLGLNICLAIMEEHGFVLSCEKNKIGTKMKIKIK